MPRSSGTTQYYLLCLLPSKDIWILGLLHVVLTRLWNMQQCGMSHLLRWIGSSIRSLCVPWRVSGFNQYEGRVCEIVLGGLLQHKPKMHDVPSELQRMSGTNSMLEVPQWICLAERDLPLWMPRVSSLRQWSMRQGLFVQDIRVPNWQLHQMRQSSRAWEVC